MGDEKCRQERERRAIKKSSDISLREWTIWVEKANVKSQKLEQSKPSDLYFYWQGGSTSKSINKNEYLKLCEGISLWLCHTSCQYTDLPQLINGCGRKTNYFSIGSNHCPPPIHPASLLCTHRNMYYVFMWQELYDSTGKCYKWQLAPDEPQKAV